MIDAHVHLWSLGRNGCTWPTPDLAPIYRDFTLDDLSQVASAAGVDRVILVQSQEDVADTAWLLSIADHPLIAGVVGWIDFQSPDLAWLATVVQGLTLALLLVFAALALRFPSRGIHDWLAGTYLVPR